jgi:oligosaccharyltransferase complex subunit beta
MKNFFEGTKPIAVPRAVAQTMGNASPLLVPILRAPSTAYVYNPKDEEGSADDSFASGQQIALASAMQARNSARFAVLGSVEALQDEWFTASVGMNGRETTTGNQEFAKQLTGWTFKELGVLKVGRLQHHLNEGANKGAFNESAYPISQLNPTIYRIKNDVVSPSYPFSTSFTIHVTNIHLDLHNRALRMAIRPLGTVRPTQRRQYPTRIHHALALPPA